MRTKANRHIASSPFGFFDPLPERRLKTPMPYRAESLNHSYALLFCDNYNLYRNDITIPYYPWDVLFNDESSYSELRAIVNDPRLETRPRIVASNILRAAGHEVETGELMGIVLEIRQKKGLDVLGVYNDGSARYISHKGNLTVWETQTPDSGQLIDVLFDNGRNSLETGNSLPNIKTSLLPHDHVRINYLTTAGISTEEGDLNQMLRDRFNQPLIKSGIQLIVYLMDEQRKRGRKNVFC